MYGTLAFNDNRCGKFGDHVSALYNNKQECASMYSNVNMRWDSLKRRPTLCQSLVNSMFSGLKTVLDENGWCTVNEELRKKKISKQKM